MIKVSDIIEGMSIAIDEAVDADIAAHQEKWPYYNALSLLATNKESRGKSQTIIGAGRFQIQPDEAKALDKAGLVDIIDLDGDLQAVDFTSKGRKYYRDAHAEFQNI